MKKLFISYAHTDKWQVKQLVDIKQALQILKGFFSTLSTHPFRAYLIVTGRTLL